MPDPHRDPQRRPRANRQPARAPRPRAGRRRPFGTDEDFFGGAGLFLMVLFYLLTVMAIVTQPHLLADGRWLFLPLLFAAAQFHGKFRARPAVRRYVFLTVIAGSASVAAALVVAPPDPDNPATVMEIAKWVHVGAAAIALGIAIWLVVNRPVRTA